MKGVDMRIWAALVIVVSCGACAVGVDPNLSNPTDTSYFYGQLAPYGHWTDNATYGPVWTPGSVAVGWRPYFYGHWGYTEPEGWVWQSDEEWGWATYHYGRWFNEGGVWYWVPGGQWAPAWVAWRSGEGYYGWAPLPPTVGFEAGVGLVGYTDPSPDWYCFVGGSDFVAPDLRGVILPANRTTTIFGKTRNITRYVGSGGKVVAQSVPVAAVEGAIGRPVPRMRLNEHTTPEFALKPATPGEVHAFRRTMTPAPAGARPTATPPSKASASGATPQLQAKHAQERADLEAKHTQEIHNPPPGKTVTEVRAQHAQEHEAMATRQQSEVKAPPPSGKPHP
jgi:hypothetical protein